MKFLEIGEGGKIDDLKLHRNIMVVDDISKVETFISLGKNGEILKLDAEGNEVHTQESYSQKISKERQDFFEQIKNLESEITSIKNDVMQSKVRSKIKEIEGLPIDDEFNFKRKLSELKDLSKQVGVGILTTVISAYLGY